MKKLFLFLLPVATLLIYFGCQEVPNDVDTGGSLSLLTPPAGSVCASGVVETVEAFNKDGSDILADRRILDNPLGPPVDNVFWSLGLLPSTPKYIILEFDHLYSGDNILVYESTHSAIYPLETVDVYVSSSNPYNWVLLGEANNKGAINDGRIWQSSIPLSGENVKYVKIVETTTAIHSDEADGFDVNAVCIENATLIISETAFAYNCDGDARDCFSEFGFNRWGWTNGSLDEGTYYFDLYAGAGQCDIGNGIRVGLVTVAYVGGTATVTFETCGDYVMTETHLYVGNENLPTDKKGKPTVAPGQYPYKHDDLSDVTTDVYTVPASGPIYVIAHAVTSGLGSFENWTDCGERGCVPPCNEWVVYGTSLGGSKIYSIDLATLSASELFYTGHNTGVTNWPNGNGYDSENNRLYYSVKPNQLWFYDFAGNQVDATNGIPTPGDVACGSYYNGKYYYIPQNSSILYKVTLDETIGSITSVVDVQTYSGKSFSFGDVVVSLDGSVLYGSSAVNGTGTFWSINLNDYSYTYIKDMAHMQLAYGSDGVLYGHDAGNAHFYEIDQVLGTRTDLGVLSSGGPSNGKFTDLASGPQCQ